MSANKSCFFIVLMDQRSIISLANEERKLKEMNLIENISVVKSRENFLTEPLREPHF